MSLLLKRTKVFLACVPTLLWCDSLAVSEHGRHNGLIKVRSSVHIHHVVLKWAQAEKQGILFMDQCCIQGPHEKKFVFFFLGGFVCIRFMIYRYLCMHFLFWERRNCSCLVCHLSLLNSTYTETLQKVSGIFWLCFIIEHKYIVQVFFQYNYGLISDRLTSLPLFLLLLFISNGVFCWF